jgi:hypothetical protein
MSLGDVRGIGHYLWFLGAAGGFDLTGEGEN